MNTFKILLALAVEKNWKVEHVDVQTAYLNGYLEEEIYMKQPEGYEKKGEEYKVCRLSLIHI